MEAVSSQARPKSMMVNNIIDRAAVAGVSAQATVIALQSLAPVGREPRVDGYHQEGAHQAEAVVVVADPYFTSSLTHPWS